ncbi:hypothetical protein ACOME3_009993 [Neoechinorhynchus agilis]
MLYQWMQSKRSSASAFPYQIGYEKTSILIVILSSLIFSCILSIHVIESRLIQSITTRVYNYTYYSDRIRNITPYFVKRRTFLCPFILVQSGTQCCLIAALILNVILLTLTTVVTLEPTFPGKDGGSKQRIPFVVLEKTKLSRQYDFLYNPSLYLCIYGLLVTHLTIEVAHQSTIRCDILRTISHFLQLILISSMSYLFTRNGYSRLKNCLLPDETCYHPSSSYKVIPHVIILACILADKLLGSIFLFIFQKRITVSNVKSINGHTLEVELSNLNINCKKFKFEAGWCLWTKCCDISFFQIRPFYPFADSSNGNRVSIRLVLENHDSWNRKLYSMLLDERITRLTISIPIQESIITKLDKTCKYRCIIVALGSSIQKYALLLELIKSNPLMFPNGTRVTMYWICTLDEYETYKWPGRLFHQSSQFGRDVNLRILMTKGWDCHSSSPLNRTRMIVDNGEWFSQQSPVDKSTIVDPFIINSRHMRSLETQRTLFDSGGKLNDHPQQQQQSKCTSPSSTITTNADWSTPDMNNLLFRPNVTPAHHGRFGMGSNVERLTTGSMEQINPLVARLPVQAPRHHLQQISCSSGGQPFASTTVSSANKSGLKIVDTVTTKPNVSSDVTDPNVHHSSSQNNADVTSSNGGEDAKDIKCEINTDCRLVTD